MDRCAGQEAKLPLNKFASSIGCIRHIKTYKSSFTETVPAPRKCDHHFRDDSKHRYIMLKKSEFKHSRTRRHFDSRSLSRCCSRVLLHSAVSCGVTCLCEYAYVFWQIVWRILRTTLTKSNPTKERLRSEPAFGAGRASSCIHKPMHSTAKKKSV